MWSAEPVTHARARRARAPVRARCGARRSHLAAALRACAASCAPRARACSSRARVGPRQVEDLRDLHVDTATNVTTFGSGFTLGQLYSELYPYRLSVPGGTVNDVGAAGLFLGCGRGFHTLVHGLACDIVDGVEYVDATGSLRTADARHNRDVLWMARGSGGNFPGIVTKFRVRAFPLPDLYVMDCAVPTPKGKDLMRAWTGRLDDILQPARKMYTHVSSFEMVNDQRRFTRCPQTPARSVRTPPRSRCTGRVPQAPTYLFTSMCMSCDAAEVAWFRNTMDEILQAADCTAATCCEHDGRRSWFRQFLLEVRARRSAALTSRAPCPRPAAHPQHAAPPPSPVVRRSVLGARPPGDPRSCSLRARARGTGGGGRGRDRRRPDPSAQPRGGVGLVGHRGVQDGRAHGLRQPDVGGRARCHPHARGQSATRAAAPHGAPRPPHASAIGPVPPPRPCPCSVCAADLAARAHRARPPRVPQPRA